MKPILDFDFDFFVCNPIFNQSLAGCEGFRKDQAKKNNMLIPKSIWGELDE